MSSERKNKISFPYEEIEGRRRNTRTFVANGYGYHISRHHKGNLAYMTCYVGKSCPATALIDESQKILMPKRNHNHPPTPQEFVKVKFMASLKRKVEHTDLKLSDFFKRELEKANVKNPHDLGIDFKKFESTLYQRRRCLTNKKNLPTQVDASSSYQSTDGNLQTLGTQPLNSYEEDANNVNMETVCEVDLMEVAGEGSNGEDSCSREVYTSQEPTDFEECSQDIQATTARGSNNQSPQLLPLSVAEEGASEPQQSQHTEVASGSHADANLPATAPNLPATAPSHRPPSSENYQLRHNNHLSLVLNQLAEDEAFMDVTLTAEGRPVKAHKNVLSAVSPYFSTVLRCNPCQHPIIIMPNDVRYAQLVQIISFIYRGEVSVPATELLPLMKVADLLLITGLSQKGNRNPRGDVNLSQAEGPDQPSSSPAPRPCSSPAPRPCSSPSPRPSSTPRETPLTGFDTAGTSGQQTQSKKVATASHDADPHTTADQATPPVVATVVPPSAVPAQDSDDDDSDGFDEEFLDPTPVGSPSNDTPVVDVDLSCIKEENISDESTVRAMDFLQEDPLCDPHLSSNDLLDSVPEDNSSSKASSSGTSKITRRSATMNKSALKSTTRSLNPVVLLEHVGALASASSNDIDITAKQTNSRGNMSSVGYTSRSSVELEPYVCPYCRRAFTDLTDHFTNNHITQPAFICSRCCRVYTDKTVFIAHRAKCN